MLIGPRQSGKTTLLGLLKEHIIKNGETVIYLNLDSELDASYFDSQLSLINYLKLHFGSSKGYVLIDEIQRKENAGVFLKGIYDLHPEFKLIVSGSGSMELKEKISESLAGRKQVFEISTLDFLEFLNYKTDYAYENKIKDYIEGDPLKAQAYFHEYLNFGGYPRVVLTQNLDGKIRALEEIFQSYLLKDITDLLGINKPDKFSLLVRYLANQVGNILNYNQISNILDMDQETTKRYVWYLEQTYILDSITPFYKNRNQELVKSPVVYFHDLGMRNFATGDIGRVEFSSSAGFVFENFIYFLLKKKTPFSFAKVKYWRTKAGAEVDFIIDSGIDRQVPYEVKYRNLERESIGKSLISYVKKYSPKEAYIVGLRGEKSQRIGDTEVSFIPWSHLV